MTGGVSTAEPVGDPALQTDPGGSIRSYELLRLTIGFVAIVMPLMVVAIVALVDGRLLASISESYHHTFAASVFVGSMCAFAAFLWAYQVKRERFWRLSENGWGNLGALLAVGVATFSNAPEEETRPTLSDRELAVRVSPPPPGDATQPQSPGFTTLHELLDVKVIAGIHLVSALGFFLVLLVFCMLWYRDDRAANDDTAKINYRLGGGVIVAGMILAVSTFLLGEGRLVSTLFLTGEILMVEAFGYVWLVRGTVSSRTAGTMLAVVTAPIAVMLLGFTPYAIEHPGVALPSWMSVLAAVLCVLGVIGALIVLRQHLRPRSADGVRSSRTRSSEDM